MDHLCYLCIVLVRLSRPFIAALWSPAGKGLTSWSPFVMFYCVFVTFPYGILGQVWYLIVSIPDLCSLFYFVLDYFNIDFFQHKNKTMVYFDTLAPSTARSV